MKNNSINKDCNVCVRYKKICLECYALQFKPEIFERLVRFELTSKGS